MGYSIGILNNIRNNSSQEYQDRIPEATQDNIVQIGNALSTYTTLANEFWSSLINKIGKTLIEQKLFKNKLARFKSGAVLTQQDVEEIFIDMSRAEGAYNPAGPNPLGRRTGPDVQVVYHRMNRQDVYAISIGDLDVVRVFRSEATLDAFITGLINSVYSGANYDEWLAMKNLLCTYDGYTTALYADESWTADPEMHAKDFVKTVRKLVNDLTIAPSDSYNKAGVMTWSNPSDLVLLVNKDVLAEVDVEVLAKSFNMGKTDIQVEVIPMDDLHFERTDDDVKLELYPNMKQGYAILCDKDFFRVWDTLSHMEPQRNAEGLFTNYF